MTELEPKHYETIMDCPEAFEQQLNQEGYRVWEVDGRFLLVDLMGEFIDSEHGSMEAVREYCEKNVFTFLD